MDKLVMFTWQDTPPLVLDSVARAAFGLVVTGTLLLLAYLAIRLFIARWQRDTRGTQQVVQRMRRATDPPQRAKPVQRVTRESRKREWMDE